MDKKSFFSAFNTEDKNALSNLYDKIVLAERIGVPVFVNEFYPPNIWRSLEDMKKNFNVNIYDYGIFEDCERRMIAFSSDEVTGYPVKLLRIHNKSRFERLLHRDYLGAVMALGIKREKFGDLIIQDDSCYVAICEEVSDYVKYNLSSVGKCPCIVEEVDDTEANQIKAKSEDFTIYSTSLRLDCVISSICNLSRSKAVDLIQSGKVLTDYIEAYQKDKMVELHSIITVRGYGKFKLIEQIGATQKGRLKLLLKKYI